MDATPSRETDERRPAGVAADWEQSEIPALVEAHRLALPSIRRAWGKSVEAVRDVFESYEKFLTILGDEQARTELNALTIEAAADDERFQGIRKLGAVFQRGLDGLFLDGDGELAKLTRRCGVF